MRALFGICVFAAFAAVGVGCNSSHEGERANTSADDPAFAAQVMEDLQRAQAQRERLLPVDVQVRGAHDQLVLRQQPEDGKKWIAVDIELTAPANSPAAPALDFSRVMAVSGASDDAPATLPRVQRLTSDGKPIDDRDPALESGASQRCLLVFQAPRAWKDVRLAYDGVTFVDAPVKLEQSDLRVPEPAMQATAVMSRTTDAPESLRYIVMAECADWPRAADPLDYQLRGFGPDGAVSIEANRALELDIGHRPWKIPESDRPFYPKSRTFLISYLCPENVTVLALTRGTQVINLPAIGALDLPVETWAALGLEPPVQP